MKTRINRGKLAAMLCESDMTQKALSKKSGVSKYTISAIMSGKSCSDETAQKLSAALGMELRDILE